MNARPVRRLARPDGRDLLITTHHQLGGPIMLIWNNHELPLGHRTVGVRLIPGPADQLLPAALRPGPRPDQRDPASAAARLTLQHTFATPERLIRLIRRPAPHPVPQRPHRRLSRRNLPDHQTRLSNSMTPRVQSQ